MKYVVRALGRFDRQVKKESEKSRKIIDDKIQLIKENPYRFKKIHSKKFGKVFRVRLNLDKREVRMIYAILEPNIILVCLLDRKKNYKDLEKYLNEL